MFRPFGVTPSSFSETAANLPQRASRFLASAPAPLRFSRAARAVPSAPARRDPLEQLVARDLEVLGRVAVAGVAAGLLAAGQVHDTLQQRAGDSTGFPDERWAGAVRLEPLLHSLRVTLGLELVLA